MSNLPEVVEPTTDISPQDMEKVKKYMEDGLPGISQIGEVKLKRMMELYLSGSTYWQISNVVGIKRPIVMFLSHKYKWFEAKKEYLIELDTQIKARIIDSKLISQDFLLQLVQMWQKKIGKQVKDYLESDNESLANKIDLKEVAEMRKNIELLMILNGDTRQKGPSVGVNVSGGVTIERMGDKISITPQEMSVEAMLKKMADLSRQEDNSVTEDKKNDIIVDKENK